MRNLLFAPFVLCSALCFAHENPDTAGWSDVFSKKRDSGGFLAVGIAIQNQQSLYQSAGFRLSGDVRGAYYFENGFLLEYPGFSNKFEDHPTLGYNIANVGNWEFDAIRSSAHGLIKRNKFHDGASKNATGYWGLRAIGTIAGLDTMLVYGISPNTANGDSGTYAAAWLAKSWNVNNWHLYTSLGAQYRNAAILDYYYGVSARATTLEPYKPGSGVNFIYKVGVKKPITEDWLLEGFLSYTHYASAIIDSPLSQKTLNNYAGRSEQGSNFNLSISYVF